MRGKDKMTMRNYTGTGRARCNNCGKLIPKGDMGLEFYSYHHSERHCKKCVVQEFCGVNGKQLVNTLAVLELSK